MASISPEPSVGPSAEPSVEPSVEPSIEPSIKLTTATSIVPSPSPAIIEHPKPPERIIDPAKGTFIRYSSLAQSSNRDIRSWVWRYGARYRQEGRQNGDEKDHFYCHLCSRQKWPILQGTQGAIQHLSRLHGITKSGASSSPADQGCLESGFEHQRLVSQSAFDRFKELFVRWIVYCHVAFYQIENAYFRELISFLSPKLVTKYLPKAANTIRSWIKDAFISRKAVLRIDLQRARSKISLSFDGWTSPNHRGFIGVVAMFINADGQRRITVLGVRRLEGEHTGENIGEAVVKVLEDYGIYGDQVGYFMLDNIKSNDIAVDYILRKVCPSLTPRQRRRRRLRCLGHIVNLCCKAFLFGKDADKFVEELEYYNQRGDFDAIDLHWRKQGCLGRLQNLVRYIRCTPQRREEFASIRCGGDLAEFDKLELIQSNSTRWNSWYHSITRALNVRERLNLFCSQHVALRGTKDCKDFILEPQHWFELEEIHTALHDFFEATMITQGKRAYLSDWFSTLDCLLTEIDNSKCHYEGLASDNQGRRKERKEQFTYHYLTARAEAAWEKCEEYYSNKQLNWQKHYPEDYDLPPAYYAAQVLDPRVKWAWFEQEWVHGNNPEKKEWFKRAQIAVKKLWEEEYQGQYSVSYDERQDTDKAQPIVSRTFERQSNHKRIRISAPRNVDLYEQYCESDVIPGGLCDGDKALEFWNDRYNSQRDLARFALDMLAISPMSDECERLFSSAKLLITDRRNRLLDDIIEAVECLRVWFGAPADDAFDEVDKK